MKSNAHNDRTQIRGRSRVVWRQEERSTRVGFLSAERRVWKVGA